MITTPVVTGATMAGTHVESRPVIRHHATALRLLLMAADGVGAAGLFVAVSIFRFGADRWMAAWDAAGVEWPVLAFAHGVAWVTVLALFDLYRLRVHWSLRAELVDILRAGVLLGMVTFSALFVFKLPEVSRLFLLELYVTQIAVAVVSRAILRRAFAWARLKGLNARFVIIVGTGDLAQSFADRIERHRELGLQVIGHLTPPTAVREAAEVTDPTIVTRPIIGGINDLESVLHERIVDEVAICLPVDAWHLVEPIARLCEEEGKVVRIPMDERGHTIAGGRREEFDGMPILSLVYGPDRAVGLVVKRLLDIGLASIGLLVLSPLFLILAGLVVALDSRPVLFRQIRVGLHGRPFRVVKFRTMVPDAEARLADLADRNEIKGHAFKLTDDPRLSRTGRILRATSLDELPQLWNVLRGQMSLVGPRPPLPTEVAGYDLWHRRRLSMKPGITGLWQVEARRDEDFDRWVELDLAYIDRWSVWLDLKIMARTIPAMLQGR
jgi:exopolysaccharide biosynthesis polyprenyl glycosylphosphotransferase